MSPKKCLEASYPIQLRQAIASWLPARGLPLIGKFLWSPRMLVLTMLLMAFSSESAAVDRFAAARGAVVEMYPSRRRPGKSFGGFMRMMARHSETLLSLVTTHLRKGMLTRFCDHWRIDGFLVFGVDGTKIDVPRTRANEKAFQVGGRKGSAPQMLLVSLIHLGTGLLWGWRRTHAKGSERGLLLSMLGDLPEKALLLADAGFVGYEVLAAIFSSGHRVLMRAGANVTLLEKLGYQVREKQGLVYLWPKRARRKGLAPLVLRRVVFVDGKNRPMCLLTNLLRSELSDACALGMYKRRWCVELIYRGIKQTLQRRKMTSDSPGHAEVELDWSLAGQWILGMLLLEGGGIQAGVLEGLAQALRIVRQAMRGCADRRRSLRRALEAIRADVYVRGHKKEARHWPHKKNDRPCKVPELRMASKLEVHQAKALRLRKRAA